MAVRLVEPHRILKPTGSLYLHCDPTASHYVKILLDRVFGNKNFLNEIVWAYKSGGASHKHFSRKHDVILFYAKQKAYRFFPSKEKSYNRGLKPYRFNNVEEFQDEVGWYTLVNMKDVWHIDMVGRTSKERLGYPTQKPLALLERILRASSQEGDTVLDPFCGCGTTVAAEETLRRSWIGIDCTFSSIAAIRERFRKDHVDIWKQIEIQHVPITVRQVEDTLLNQANPLFARKEFEKFCVTTVGGFPNDQMGADGGIDGRIPLLCAPERAICSVKSGKVTVEQVRSLKGLLGQHQHDVAGMFISRHKSTSPMLAFAKQAGVHTPKGTDLFRQIDPFPRLQLLTLEELLNGKQRETT